MNRKNVFVVLAAMALAAGYGCSDDGVAGLSGRQTCTVDGEKTCSQTGDVLVCKDGFYEPTACLPGTTCYLGECSAKCTPSTHVMTCDGENAHFICNDLGMTVSEPCEKGNVCHQGYCRDESMTACDNSYKDSCRDSHTMLQCMGGYVVSHPCKEGEVCFNGVCGAAKPCDASYSPECGINGTIIQCIDGYETPMYCDGEQVCRNGACSNECDEGFVECTPDGTSQYYCENGKIRTKICSSNVCKDKACVLDVCSQANFKPRCVDGQLERCSDIGVVERIDCVEGTECINGTCTVSGSCDAGTYTPVCQSESSVTICGPTGSKTPSSCDTGEVCEGGICQKPGIACTSGSDYCVSANVVRECQNDTWHSKYCKVDSEVCVAGACVDASTATTCNMSTAGSASCDGSAVVKCEFGYLAKYDCATNQHCMDGICYDNVKEGDSCDPATFTSQCLDGVTSYICSQDGIVTKFDCGDQICKAGQCTDAKCDPATFVTSCSGDFEQLVCEGSSVVKKACAANQHCAAGGCVDDPKEGEPCQPDKFSSRCTADGKVLECKLDGEDYKVVASECSGDLSACFNGACAECNPDSYVPGCSSDNKPLVCVDGSLVPQEACSGDKAVCLDGECVACDPAKYTLTCSENALLSCNDKNEIEKTDCPTGYHCDGNICSTTCSTNSDCALEHYECKENKCVFVPECDPSQPSVCSGDRLSVQVCAVPGLKKEIKCAENEICYEGKCVDKRCDGVADGQICQDGKTSIYCQNGKVTKTDSCPSLCLDGVCAECDPLVTTPTCNGSNITAHICDPSSKKYKDVTCSSTTEKCVEGFGCVDKCGKDFKPSCDTSGNLSYCDYSGDGSIKNMACDFQSTCVDGRCESRAGKACVPATFPNACHEDGGRIYLETCDRETKTVEFVYYYASSENFCGTIKGETNFYSICNATDVANNTTWCSTWDGIQYIGKCEKGIDYKGNEKYGILRQSGLCENGNSISCRVDTTAGHNSHIVFDYTNCGLNGGGTCTNGSCGFASCSAVSATCSGTKAQNCFYDPTYNSGEGGNVYAEIDCATAGGTCAVVNSNGVSRAVCNKSAGNFVFSDGTTHSVSTLGTCDGNTLHVLYWEDNNTTDARAHSMGCHNACVTETSGGVTFSYCK